MTGLISITSPLIYFFDRLISVLRAAINKTNLFPFQTVVSGRPNTHFGYDGLGATADHDLPFRDEYDNHSSPSSYQQQGVSAFNGRHGQEGFLPMRDGDSNPYSAHPQRPSPGYLGPPSDPRNYKDFRDGMGYGRTFRDGDDYHTNGTAPSSMFSQVDGAASRPTSVTPSVLKQQQDSVSPTGQFSSYQPGSLTRNSGVHPDGNRSQGPRTSSAMQEFAKVSC